MRRAWSIPLCAGVLASAPVFACTFGANDYKIVPASSGGSAGQGDTGGTGNSGNVSEGGVAGESTGCVIHTQKPLVVFAPEDLYNTTVDRFTVVPGITEVFALAFVTVPNGPLMQTHAILRAITDANFGTVRGIADLAMPGTFVFGGAWATATEIDIVGADARGIVQLTLPVNAMGNPDLSVKTNLVVTSLDTPTDCATTVRTLRISKNLTGGPSYVATCLPDATKPASYSLWINTPALTKTIQIAPAAVDLNNSVRSFVRNGPSGATTNLILVGNDDTPSTAYRTGNGQADLKTVSELTMSNDAGWLQEVITEPAGDADGGTFMTVAKSHSQAAGYAPVEIWAGQVASNAYASLTAVPPTQLKQIATYDSASAAFFPQGWTYRNNSVYVLATDQYVQHNLQLWTLDTTGAKIAPDFSIYSSNDTGNTLSDPRSSALTLADIVAWVETSGSSTAIYAESVSCP